MSNELMKMVTIIANPVTLSQLSLILNFLEMK